MSAKVSFPFSSRLTRSVTPVTRSWTNTSDAPFVSSGTSVVASLSNATNRPSPEIVGDELSWSPGVPSEATLTTSYAAVWRS